MIRLSRPTIGEEERAAVDAVLSSGMLVQGAQVARFEALLAARCGRKHGIAVSSGTAALELALRAAGVGPGDEVLCPALTWPSPANAIRLVGAIPVLVDVDPLEWNATGAAFAAARTDATRAAILIDQFGNPLRARETLDALPDLALIEDAACALGSRTDLGPCGSVGLVSCMSFHPRKVITTGEGGVCLTDDDALADRLRRLRNHGQAAPGVFEEVSMNFRLTELGGALGVSQMTRLDAILAARRALLDRYRAALPKLGFQRCPPGGRENAQTAGALLPEGTTEGDRERLIARLREDGVEVGRLSYALSRVPSLGLEATAVPVSEDLVTRGLALPLYPGMTEEEQARVVRAVEAAL
jgi:perosamine synthetase